MKKAFSKLSERQQKILRFMQNYMEEAGYPPTIREIGEDTGINSTSVVNYNLNKLVDAGYLERTDKVSRGLRLVGEIPGTRKKKVIQATQTTQVPLVGHIAAGQPIQLPDDTGQYYDDDDMIDVPANLLGNNDPAHVFALTVRGDSMIDAMIADGDIVLLRRRDLRCCEQLRLAAGRAKSFAGQHIGKPWPLDRLFVIKSILHLQAG